MLRAMTMSLCLLSGGLVEAAPFNFDFSRKLCMNDKGVVGRNPEQGICGDQQGLDLSGASLSGLRLTGSDYSQASLSKASIENAYLEYVVFQSASLDGASLSSSKLLGAKAESANFDLAELGDADAREANFTGASFVDGRLDYFVANEAKLDQAHFLRAQIRGARFRSVTMNSTDWREVEGDSADFSSANGSKADFTGAHLSSAIFRGANLMRAKFYNADLYQVDFRNSNLKGADLRGLRAGDALFNGAKFDSGTLLPFAKEQALSLGMVFDSAPLPDGNQVLQVNEKTLVSVSLADKKIVLWENGGLSTTMPLNVPSADSFYSLRISTGGERLALCIRSGSSTLLVIQNLKSQMHERTEYLDQGDGCSSLQWSPDGKFIAAVQPWQSNARHWVDVFSAATGERTLRKKFDDKSLGGRVHFLSPNQLFYTASAADSNGSYQDKFATAYVYDLTTKLDTSLFALPENHRECWIARLENQIPTCYTSGWTNNLVRSDTNGSRSINFYQYVQDHYLYYFVRDLFVTPDSNQLVAVIEDTSRQGVDGDYYVQLIPSDLSSQGRPVVSNLLLIRNFSLSEDGKKFSLSRYLRTENNAYRDQQTEIYDLKTGLREYSSAAKSDTVFTATGAGHN